MLKFNHDLGSVHEAIGLKPEEIDALVKKSNDIATEVFTKRDGKASVITEKATTEFTHEELAVVFALTYKQLVEVNERLVVGVDVIMGNLPGVVNSVMAASVIAPPNAPALEDIEVVETKEE